MNEDKKIEEKKIDEIKPKSEVSIITVIMLAVLILSALILLYVSAIRYQNSMASNIQTNQEVIAENIN